MAPWNCCCCAHLQHLIAVSQTLVPSPSSRTDDDDRWSAMTWSEIFRKCFCEKVRRRLMASFVMTRHSLSNRRRCLMCRKQRRQLINTMDTSPIGVASKLDGSDDAVGKLNGVRTWESCEAWEMVVNKPDLNLRIIANNFCDLFSTEKLQKPSTFVNIKWQLTNCIQFSVLNFSESEFKYLFSFCIFRDFLKSHNLPISIPIKAIVQRLISIRSQPCGIWYSRACRRIGHRRSNRTRAWHAEANNVNFLLIW